MNDWTMLLYFGLAGICEIGGGYLLWLWLRTDRSPLFGVGGSVLLILYGVVAAQQPANFGRVYAAYGGWFILLSLLWGWLVDGTVPDRFDVLGSVIAVLGATLICFAPREWE